MNTLTKLYLGSVPVNATVEGEQLIILLEDGRRVMLPLGIVSQLITTESWPIETQVLILRQPPTISHVQVTDSALNVYLEDGRMLSSPLAWFPRLLYGSPAERNHYELSGDDDVIHWPDLDEDIELLRLLQGGTSSESERSLQRWLRSRKTPA